MCFPFSSSRILIFMYSTFLCCRISLEFCVTGVGALDDRGETDVRRARDPGIPIKFTPSTPHCSAVQLHPNTNTPKYVPLLRDPVH